MDTHNTKILYDKCIWWKPIIILCIFLGFLSLIAWFIWPDEINYNFVIISIASAFSIMVICYTILLIKLNNQILQEQKIQYLSDLKSKINFDSSQNDFKIIKEIRNKNNQINKKEFYPQNKAAVDLFKAYSSALAEI